jgi:hypothetical protein
MTKTSGKLKYKHSMIEGLRVLLESIEPWEEIQSIIPGRIEPHKSSKGGLKLKVQYNTNSGLKCIARNTTAVQEVFIVTDQPDLLTKKLKLIS